MDEAEIYNRQRIAQLELKSSLRETLAQDISHFSEDKKRQIAAQILQLDPRERRDEEIQALKYLTEHLDFFVKINSKKFNQENKLDEKICRRMKYQSSKKGDVVIEYGAKADKFFILLSGEVSIFLMKSPEAIEHEANESHKVTRKMKFTQITHPNETPHNEEETNKNSNSNISIVDDNNNRSQPRKSTFLSNKPLPSQRKSSSIQSPFAASEDLSERFNKNRESFKIDYSENQKDNEQQQQTPFNKLLLKMPYLISSNLQSEQIIDQSANTTKSMFYNNNIQQNSDNTPLYPQSQGSVNFFGNGIEPEFLDQRQQQRNDLLLQLSQKPNLTSQDSQRSILLQQQQDNTNSNIISKLMLTRKQSFQKPSALALVQRVFKHRNFEQNPTSIQALQDTLLKQNSQCDRNLFSPQTQSNTGESSLQGQTADRFTFTDAIVNQNSNNKIITNMAGKTKLSSVVSRWLEIKHHTQEQTTFGDLSLNEIENVERFFTQDSCIFKFTYRDKLQPGSTFGELGILEGKPRSALIVCSADSEFAIMEKKDYSELLAQRDRKHLLQKFSFLKTHLFPDLTNDAIKKIFYSFQKRTFKRNEIFFQEGQQANGLFIIKKGEVGLSYKTKMKNPEEICLDEGSGDGVKDVRDEDCEDLDTVRSKALFYKPAIYTNKTFAVIGRGEYFGEEDMLMKEHQLIRQFTATVISMECSVYFVDGNFLMKFLKSKPTSSLIMQERLNRKIKWRRDYQQKTNQNIVLNGFGTQKNNCDNMLFEKQIIQQKLAIISQKNEYDLRRKSQQRKQQLQQQQPSQQLQLGRLRCLLQHSSLSSQYLSRESPWSSSKDLFQTQIITSSVSQPTKGIGGNTSQQLNLIEEEEQHHGDSSQRQNIKECFTNIDNQKISVENNKIRLQGSSEIRNETQKNEKSSLKMEIQQKQDTTEQPIMKLEQQGTKQQDQLKSDQLPDAISYPKESTLSQLKHLKIQRRPQSQISLRNRCNYSLDQSLQPSELSTTQTTLSNMRETKSICSFLSFKQYFFNRQLSGQAPILPSPSNFTTSNLKIDNTNSISDGNSSYSKSYPMKHIFDDQKLNQKLSKQSETDITFLPKKLLNSSKEGNYKNQQHQLFKKKKHPQSQIENTFNPQSCSYIDCKTNYLDTNNSLGQTTKKHRQFSFSLSPSKIKGNIQNSSSNSSSQDIIFPYQDNSSVSGNNLNITRNQSNNITNKTATQISRDSVVTMCLRKIKKKTDSIDSILRKIQAQPETQQIKQTDKINIEQMGQHRSVTPDVSSQDLRMMRKWSEKRERKSLINPELIMSSKQQMMDRGKLGRLKIKGAAESNLNSDDSMNNFSVLHFLPINQKSIGSM